MSKPSRRLRERRDLQRSRENYIVKFLLAGPDSQWRGQTGQHQSHLTQIPSPAAAPTPTPGDAPLPPPARSWVNLQSLGIKGDGVTDETAAIQRAIDEHPVLYIPTGRYLVTDTIHLRPDSVLIGCTPA